MVLFRMLNKKEIRENLLKVRNKITNKDEKSRLIIEKVINDPWYKEAKVIAIYKSLFSEVNTKDLIKECFEKNKIVLLPKIEKGFMNFYKIDENEKLLKSKFGVEEPLGLKEKLYTKNQIDLMIVPGVGFDKDNNRIGFGKGYYDKYLENTNIKTVGICFKEQIVDKLPHDEFDIRMDKIICD